MLYRHTKFTLPASNNNQSEIRWDLGFMTEQEFEQKYGKPKDIILLELETK
jgi:hypothetical protein